MVPIIGGERLAGSGVFASVSGMPLASLGCCSQMMVPHMAALFGAHRAMRIWASPVLVSQTPDTSQADADAAAMRASAAPATATRRVIGKSCDREREARQCVRGGIYRVLGRM